MPHLRAYGRKLLVGSDDLVLPGIVTSAARAFLLMAIGAVTLMHSDELFNEEACGELALYAALSIAMYACSVSYNTVVWCTACRGGVMEPRARACLPHVLLGGLIMSAAEVALAIYGAMELNSVDPDAEDASVAFSPAAVNDRTDNETTVSFVAAASCDADVVLLLREINYAHWCYMWVGVCCFGFFYCGSTSSRKRHKPCVQRVTGLTNRGVSEHAHLVRRMTKLKCCCPDVDNSVLETVARELHVYFKVCLLRGQVLNRDFILCAVVGVLMLRRRVLGLGRGGHRHRRRAAAHRPAAGRGQKYAVGWPPSLAGSRIFMGSPGQAEPSFVRSRLSRYSSPPT